MRHADDAAPKRRQNWHPLGPNQALVGHVACLGHRGSGHTTARSSSTSGVQQALCDTAKGADYLKAVLSAAPILGTEYATPQGTLLLRVSGKLSSSVADQYQPK
jgi:hypothetical protein